MERFNHYQLAFSLKSLGMNHMEDSQCIIYEFNYDSSSFVELGKTESSISANASKWTNKIQVNFFPLSIQKLQFSLLNIFEEETFSTSCNLSSLLVSKPKVLLLENSEKKLAFSITEERKTPEVVKIQLEAKQVDKKDIFGKSDPYFFIFKSTQQGWSEVFRSEIIKNTLNPTWRQFSLSADVLGGLSNNTALRIEVWDWDRNKKDDFIGAAVISLSEILTSGFEIPLIEQKKKMKNKNYENSGVLKVINAIVETHFSFVDFLLEGGWIGFGFAVDFTVRNGHSSLRNSLHYIETSKKTRYEELILSFNEFLQEYNQSSIKVYGFGASSARLKPVSGFFSLKQESRDFDFSSMNEFLSCYRDSIPLIVFSEDSNLCPLIEDFQNSLKNQSNGGYFILFIMLCCEVSSVIALQEQLAKTSSSPLSIVFIEVSNHMINSESTFRPSSFSSQSRENILFIRLKDFQSPSKASSFVLDRLPHQLEDYLNHYH
jgi:hypothetical protein